MPWMAALVSSDTQFASNADGLIEVLARKDSNRAKLGALGALRLAGEALHRHLPNESVAENGCGAL